MKKLLWIILPIILFSCRDEDPTAPVLPLGLGSSTNPPALHIYVEDPIGANEGINVTAYVDYQDELHYVTKGTTDNDGMVAFVGMQVREYYIECSTVDGRKTSTFTGKLKGGVNVIQINY